MISASFNCFLWALKSLRCVWIADVCIPHSRKFCEMAGKLFLQFWWCVCVYTHTFTGFTFMNYADLRKR